MNIVIGAAVRTRDGYHVGEVHRVVVDLVDQAVTAIVVLQGHLLSRDVLVPFDFIDHQESDEVVLRLDHDRLEELPDFVYNEFLAPPPAWTLAGPYPDGSVYVPLRQRKRLGEHHIDITAGSRVLTTDGDIGSVDKIELQADSGELDAFWVRAGRVFAHDLRLPAEWVDRIDDAGVHVGGSRIEVETGLGPLSRARREEHVA
ncbi:MAG TPA: PRC-barrel domain-containing protein [Chloroflexota bacterium]|nr:PRC-barrel domain-containing protein [Chloroflexota bacterium]